MSMPVQRPPSHHRASTGLPNWAIILAVAAVVVVIGLLVGGALGV
ncbi:MAG TPA: hypothetical protein VLZ73_08865 [Brevundimonas sp.]|nr:hypothetical protein [Brevundimonas sp.]